MEKEKEVSVKKGYECKGAAELGDVIKAFVKDKVSAGSQDAGKALDKIDLEGLGTIEELKQSLKELEDYRKGYKDGYAEGFLKGLGVYEDIQEEDEDIEEDRKVEKDWCGDSDEDIEEDNGDACEDCEDCEDHEDGGDYKYYATKIEKIKAAAEEAGLPCDIVWRDGDIMGVCIYSEGEKEKADAFFNSLKEACDPEEKNDGRGCEKDTVDERGYKSEYTLLDSEDEYEVKKGEGEVLLMDELLEELFGWLF